MIPALSLQSLLSSFSASYGGLSAIAALMIFAGFILAILFLVFSPAFFVAALARRKVENILNERENLSITQYNPPHDLLPAELGLLYDMQVSENELVATLFNLQHRGIIEFKDYKKVRIVRRSQYEELTEFEKIAVMIADGDSSDEMRGPIEYIDPSTGIVELRINWRLPKKSRLRFQLAVQQSVENKGVRLRDFHGAFTLRVIVLSFLLSLLPMSLIAFSGTYNGEPYAAWSLQAFFSSLTFSFILGIFLFPVYIVVSILILKLWTTIAGRYWLNTKQARAYWPEIEGYRRFLEVVELDNIQFESKSNSGFILDTLPYAIALGMDTKWQELLKDHNKNTMFP